MLTVTMIFLLATYVMATFIHISNISAVTEWILTKHFGPNFLLTKLFLHPKCFWTKIFFYFNFFCQILVYRNIFDFRLNQNFFWDQNLFRPDFFVLIFSDPKLLGPKFLSTVPKYFELNLFWT